MLPVSLAKTTRSLEWTKTPYATQFFCNILYKWAYICFQARKTNVSGKYIQRHLLCKVQENVDFLAPPSCTRCPRVVRQGDKIRVTFVFAAVYIFLWHTTPFYCQLYLWPEPGHTITFQYHFHKSKKKVRNQNLTFVANTAPPPVSFFWLHINNNKSKKKKQ